MWAITTTIQTGKAMTNQRVVELIKDAIKLANISVYLGLLAVGCFCVFGTLASLANFKDNTLIYWAFHYLPYVLIGLSMPMSVYHVFILGRYHIIQKGILQMILAVGVGLLMFALAMWLMDKTVQFYMSLFLAMIAWFGMPFLFRVNLKKFLNFLENPNP